MKYFSASPGAHSGSGFPIQRNMNPSNAMNQRGPNPNQSQFNPHMVNPGTVLSIFL